MRPGRQRAGNRYPVVLAVDGRSSGGKTTLAGRLQGAVPGSAAVHTDDIAWWYSRFGWADLLADGILTPARAGRPVSYRPPQWDERQRHGAIEAPADCPLLIVEGVGAARREIAHLTDAAIWVQADERETERRNLARVGQPGGSPTVRHLREWMAEEMPFLASQQPWESADLIACGTPQIPLPMQPNSWSRRRWPPPARQALAGRVKHQRRRRGAAACRDGSTNASWL
jgi:hypothetical protein